MAARKCRLWWPDELLTRDSGSGLLLFGWFINSVSSIDIVVATAASPCDVSVYLRGSDLKEMLHAINGKMPMSLETTKFSLLGHCVSTYNSKKLTVGKNYNNLPSESVSEQPQCLGDEPISRAASSCVSVSQPDQESTRYGDFARWNCGCEKLDKFIEPCRQSLIRDSNWIQLLLKSQRILCKETRCVPDIHHVHLNGHIVPSYYVHLIIYEPPTFGSHHFALNPSKISKHLENTLKRPSWVDELHKKPMLPDLDMVVLALNTASAATLRIQRSLGIPVKHFSRKSILASMLWHTVALFVASVSTLIYIIIQFCYSLLRYESRTFLMTVQKLFKHTWKNLHIRISQFLYWPFFLQGYDFSSQSNVEYAHRAALRKHLIWSSFAMDVLLGMVFGVALLAYLDIICVWVMLIVRCITDILLRSGCVWLMGVPAGFKLNIELAEVLGMISLNAIQVFSTFWFFMASLLRYFIGGLALAGILWGLTVPVALCIDMIKLSTLHVLTLHWVISFLYSQQIQALASLWRLFRGRKWNPLRQRLDSYEYSVEEHVVGSLLFTPLLLLLPTTSVFYIFFTILHMTITFICIILETTISVLHATPYAEILLWITRRGRFPCGIWLEVISYPGVSTSVSHESPEEADLPSDLNQTETDFFVYKGRESVISLLHSSYTTIGQVIAPHYRNVFHEISSSLGKSWAHGVFSGQRVPSTLRGSLPPTMPWMQISIREYWRQCRISVLACRS